MHTQVLDAFDSVFVVPTVTIGRRVSERASLLELSAEWQNL
jgi:hypothetical protein